MSKVTLTSSNFPNTNSVYVSCVCMCVCVCVFKLYEKTTFLRSIYEQKNSIFDMIV